MPDLNAPLHVHIADGREHVAALRALVITYPDLMSLYGRADFLRALAELEEGFAAATAGVAQ